MSVCQPIIGAFEHVVLVEVLGRICKARDDLVFGIVRTLAVVRMVTLRSPVPDRAFQDRLCPRRHRFCGRATPVCP